MAAVLPAAVEPSNGVLAAAHVSAESVRGRMVALQEELDWEVYGLYGLVEGEWTLPEVELPELNLGERAFEIVLARQVAAGEEQTTWFERHGATPITEIPAHWPAAYRELVQRRIDLIDSDRSIGLIERPECKRRWQWELWDVHQQRALRSWLLDRLEGTAYWEPDAATVVSCARLADKARADARFVEVAQLYAPDRDLGKLVQELVLAESVPAVASARYTESGMRVRAEWEQTWRLQRAEDTIDAFVDLPEADPHRLTADQAAARKAAEVGTIPVPGKYTQKDFRKATYWKLRGKLDVPKERFILYPDAQVGNDPTPVIGWAGWDHLQRARATAQLVLGMRTDQAPVERVTPILAALYETLPWVHQWHPDIDPTLGQTPGRAYDAFLRSQLDELHLTHDDLREHTPIP